jgi:sugar/nucleoside kinase (ribokinase family)
MLRNKAILALVLAALMWPAGASAQNAVITGTVRTQTQMAVRGALVSIEQLELSAVTNDNGNFRIVVPAERVQKVVDTTGAGDLYAAGFLHGYTKKMPLRECARIGALCAAEIVSHFGARPETPLTKVIAGQL